MTTFESWFGDSCAVDSAGAPLILYRGEHGNIDEHGEFSTNVACLTFTSDPAVASVYACEPNDRQLAASASRPRVYAVHLAISNPLINVLNDSFMDFSFVQEKFGRDVAIKFAVKYSAAIVNTSNWMDGFADEWGEDVHALLQDNPQAIDLLYVEAYHLLDDAEFIEIARMAGYDGCVYGGSGESALTAEYRIFDVSQLKSAFIHFHDAHELASRNDVGSDFSLG